MNYLNAIQKFENEIGKKAVKILIKEAVSEIKSENPTVKFTVSKSGVSITNYNSALKASEEGSLLCRGQEVAESFLENEICTYIYHAKAI